MKKKIIGVAKKDLKRGEEIIFVFDDGWHSEQVRLYKQGHRFLYRLARHRIKKCLRKILP